MKENGVTWKGVQRWWPIIIVVVAGAVAFTTLRMEVNAMQDKGVLLRKDYEETKLRQDMLIIKQAELLVEFEHKLTRLETVVEFMENGN